jgi:hypothetical protein
MTRGFPLLKAVRAIRNIEVGGGSETLDELVRQAREPVELRGFEEVEEVTPVQEDAGKEDASQPKAALPLVEEAVPQVGECEEDPVAPDEETGSEPDLSRSTQVESTTCPICLRKFVGTLPTLHGKELCQECLDLLR